MHKQGSGETWLSRLKRSICISRVLGRPGSSVIITSKNLKLTTQAHMELNPGAISSSYSGSKDLLSGLEKKD